MMSDVAVSCCSETAKFAESNAILVVASLSSHKHYHVA